MTRKVLLWLMLAAALWGFSESPWFSRLPSLPAKRNVGLAFGQITLPFPGPGGVSSPGVAWGHTACGGTFENIPYNGGGPGSATLSLTCTPAAGSLLIFVAGITGTSPLPISITDNSSGPPDSWTSVALDEPSGVLQAWATNVTTGTAPTTVTFNVSHTYSLYVSLMADDYTAGPNPFVQDGVAATNNGTSATPSVVYTTGSAAGDLLWSVDFNTTSGCDGYITTVASPFTKRENDGCQKSITSDAGVPSGMLASTGYTATYTASGSGVNWIVATVGFKAP